MESVEYSGSASECDNNRYGDIGLARVAATALSREQRSCLPGGCINNAKITPEMTREFPDFSLHILLFKLKKYEFLLAIIVRG